MAERPLRVVQYFAQVDEEVVYVLFSNDADEVGRREALELCRIENR